MRVAGSFHPPTPGGIEIDLRVQVGNQRFPVTLDLARLVARFGPGDPLSLDVLFVAAATYVADKLAPRDDSRDCWTRDFEVTFPVWEPSRWNAAEAPLREALCFLTGDRWTVEFAQRNSDVGLGSLARLREPRIGPVTVVSLFSGGLDSFAGACQRLQQGDERIALIGHLDSPGPMAAQEKLHAAIEKQYPGRTWLSTTRVRPGHDQVEPTLRSRSLVFLALGLYAARSFGPQIPLLMPENGFIGINIPLTPSRLGSCSTRTTHPYFLARLNTALAYVGITNPIVNPLRYHTKGEVAELCAAGPLAGAIPDSVSCAHPTRRMLWARKAARNCGYCFPCLIRRAGLNRVGLDNGQDYGIDIFAREMDLRSGAAKDFRAVVACIRDLTTTTQISHRTRLTGPLGNEAADFANTVGRGLGELRALFARRAPDLLRVGTI